MNKKTAVKIAIVAVVAAAIIIVVFRLKQGSIVKEPISSLTVSVMKITSTVFENNREIPSKYTCEGADHNPPLEFADVPAEAKSLVLLVDDPDAPSGDWVHWLLWNIDPKTTGINEKSVPDGAIEGTTSFGQTGWGGPCPPSGTHRYRFKLYALDTVLNISSATRKEDILLKMEGHVLDQSILTGLYSRK